VPPRCLVSRALPTEWRPKGGTSPYKCVPAAPPAEVLASTKARHFTSRQLAVSRHMAVWAPMRCRVREAGGAGAVAVAVAPDLVQRAWWRHWAAIGMVAARGYPHPTPSLPLHSLRVQEVGRHQQLQRDFWLNFKFRHLGAVRVAHLVMEVFDYLFQNRSGNLREVHSVFFRLRI